jgi:peptide deformylase
MARKQEPKLEICVYGHPVLREKAEPIAKVDSRIRDLAEAMFKVMYDRKGIGLAAQQVGKTIQICTLDLPAKYDLIPDTEERLNPHVAMPLVMINPEIVARVGSQTGEEACLSVPEVAGAVERAYEITVSFRDVRGGHRELTVKGMMARLVQHELDHLDGVLFVDRLSAFKRLTLTAQLHRLQRQAQERLALPGAPV